MTAAEIIILPPEASRSLFDRMGQFRRQVRGRLALEGCARLLASALALALITFLLDRGFRLSLPARRIMLLAASIALGVVAWRHLLLPLRLKLDPLTLASALDRAAGQLASPFTASVATVIELPGLLASRSPPSAAMVRQAVARCHQILSTCNFRQRLDDRRRNLALSVSFVSLFLPLVILLAAPATTALWAERLFAGSNIPWPQKTYLDVAGVDHGVLVVPRGEPFVLRVAAKPGSVVPDVVSLRYRETGSSRVTTNFTLFGANDFRYDFAGVNGETNAQVWGGDDEPPPFTIRPADRPRIVDLKLIAQHPWQPKPQTYTFSGDDADLSFLPLTRLQLLFTANTPIALARLTSSASRPSAVDLKQLDDEHFSIAWTQRSAVQVQLELIGRDAALESSPTAVTIGLKIDQPPRIALAYTGVHSRVSPQAHIPLTFDARDDYGVARVAMSTKAERPDPANPAQLHAEVTSADLFGPVSPAHDLEIQQSRTIDLSPLKLLPGSLFTVTASATDDCYTGPQTTQSRPVTFRVVPPEELFREIMLRQQAERAKFRKQTDDAHALGGLMTTLSTAADATQIAHRHRAIQREVIGITTALNETVTEMRLNALATEEAYTLIQNNVLAPLKSLNENLLNPQKDALDVLRPDDSKSLAAVEDRQDQIVAQMEEILKQMSQWDSFVDVLNQLNEIIRLQDQAQQSTKQLKKQQMDNVFEK